jgi:hypothetical protein
MSDTQSTGGAMHADRERAEDTCVQCGAGPNQPCRFKGRRLSFEELREKGMTGLVEQSNVVARQYTSSHLDRPPDAVLTTRRRLADALHAMHRDQFITVDAAKAEELQDAWDEHELAVARWAVNAGSAPALPTSNLMECSITRSPHAWRPVFGHIATTVYECGSCRSTATFCRA